jgi:isoleucyl-tRNA synthetase
MQMSQKFSSMVLSLRKRAKIRVRQPLNKIMIPVRDEHFRQQVDKVKDLILAEVNVKEVEYLDDSSGILVKKVKPNFKALGPRYGKMMKAISAAVAQMDNDQIAVFENSGKFELDIDGTKVELVEGDLEIITQDIPGWAVATMGNLTVALDVTLTPELIDEGLAREFINRIQNLRKDLGFDVVDKIIITVEKHGKIEEIVNKYFDYICSETLATQILFAGNSGKKVELSDDILLSIDLQKVI